MTVYVDPPAWPAHGRLWSHLVSDTSLLELRTLAREVGIPDRAFDLDHYDVPAERHGDLVAAGAIPLDGGALARRLARSDLRVPGFERRRAKRAALLARWVGLWPAEGSGGPDPDQVVAVGEELVGRWAEPHRVYHSPLHLADTLDAVVELSGPGDDTRTATLALWFHDVVHDGATPDDEERSATLALDLLAPLTGDDTAEVVRLVRLTAGHDPEPDDATGALVSDADLAVLGAAPARYRRYAAQVRAEYGHVPDDAFRIGRAAVLDELLALHDGPGLFRTTAGRTRWAAQAATNLRAELASLRADQ